MDHRTNPNPNPMSHVDYLFSLLPKGDPQNSLREWHRCNQNEDLYPQLEGSMQYVHGENWALLKNLYTEAWRLDQEIQKNSRPHCPTCAERGDVVFHSEGEECAWMENL